MRKRKNRRITFHEDCIEPTDGEFLDHFSKYTKSSWLALAFLMACLPTYCRDLVSICNTASHDLESTCLVSGLINKMRWNLTSLRKLTMPDKGRSCTYLDYNYSIFDNMEPEEAFKVKDQVEVPPVKICAIKVAISESYSFTNRTKTLLKSCVGFEFKKHAKLYQDLFGAISYIVSGILGDIFGRKIVFIVCFFIVIFGVLLTPQAASFQSLIAGLSVQAIGVSGIVIMNYIIFAELCSKNIRGILMLYITLFGTMAKISGYMTKSYTFSYEQTCYLFSIPVCSMLLYLYIVPESPRWLLSYGKKERAWKILKTWGEDVSQYVFLPEIKLSKWYIFTSNIGLLFRVSKYRRTIVVMTWIKFSTTMVLGNLERYVKVKNINATSHRMLLLMSEMFSFFSILPPFILFGRYISLFIMLLSGALCLTISIFIKGGEGWYLLNILAAQYVYALNYVVVLYSLELLPTSARGTGLGLLWGVGDGFGVLGKSFMSVWILEHVMADYEMYAMVSLQVTAILLMILLPNLRVGDLPDWKRYRSVMDS